MVHALGRLVSIKMVTVNSKKRLYLLTAAVLIGVAAFLLCGKQKPAPPVVPHVEHAAMQPGNRYDLARDEARGGHTLERHIGKSDAELRERLESESISADSTYADRATAEMAVGAAIRENSGKIDRWQHRPGGHSNLVLDYDSSSPLGASIHRGDRQSFPCSHAVAILKWLSPSEYYVLTSYPECWRAR